MSGVTDRAGKVIGVTGGIGTGKSTVCAMFQDCGGRLIDTDRIVHWEMAHNPEMIQRIARAFGPGVLRDRRVDRSRLADIVFKEETKRRLLESIIHPVVWAHIQGRMRQEGAKEDCWILDIPLLFETGWQRRMDATVVVTASERTQVQRARQRLRLSEEEVRRRLQAQMPLEEKVRLADFVIDNSGSLEETRRQVKQIWERIQFNHIGRSSNAETD